MGLSARRTLVVPDAQSWAVWGLDLRRAGVEPAVSPERARGLLVPDRIPAALQAALREAAGRVPADGPPTVHPAPLDGLPAAAVLIQQSPATPHEHRHGGDDGPGHAHDHGDHEADAHAMADHGDHGDHGDMMAIVGDPSADGLVMEDVEVRLGPLAPGLPGGLVLAAVLDGDVVAEALVTATLAMTAEGRDRGLPPDSLAPLAWRCVLRRARGEEHPADVAALEVERALSHAAWLAALATVVGYPRLGDLAGRAVGPLVAARAATLGQADVSTAIDDARSSVHALQAFCTDDRGLRMRLGGLGALAAAELAARGVGGPVARASGLDVDARADDRRYAAIGFLPLAEEGGDALARTRLRAREAAAALGLAAALLGRDDSVTGDASVAPAGGVGIAVSVEGPRGPLRVTARPHGAPAVEAPGHAALLELAGRAMQGLEHASALAVLVSFDLSPWRVGP